MLSSCQSKFKNSKEFAAAPDFNAYASRNELGKMPIYCEHDRNIKDGTFWLNDICGAQYSGSWWDDQYEACITNP
jgi:hypothetical protein